MAPRIDKGLSHNVLRVNGSNNTSNNSNHCCDCNMWQAPPKYTDDLPPAYEDVVSESDTPDMAPTMAILPRGNQNNQFILNNIDLNIDLDDMNLSNLNNLNNLNINPLDEILKDYPHKLENDHYFSLCAGCATIHSHCNTTHQDLDLFHSICACEEEYHFHCAVSRVAHCGPICPKCHTPFMTNEQYVQIPHKGCYDAMFFPSAPIKGNIMFPDPMNQDNIYIISSEVIYIQFLILYMQHRELYKYLQKISTYSVSRRKTLLDELLNTSGSIKALPYLNRLNQISMKEFNLDVVCLSKNIRNQCCFKISENVQNYFDKVQNVEAFLQIEAGLELFFKPVFVVYHNEKHRHQYDGRA